MQARRIEYMALGRVQGAKRNPKQHDKEAIAASVKRHGLVEVPTLDERTERLVAGHGRIADLAARKAAGLPAPDGVRVEAEDWFVPVLRGWASKNDAQADAYLVASNELAHAGGWDEDSLARLLADVRAGEGGLEGTGYSSKDVDKLLASIEKPSTGNAEPNEVPDALGDVRVKPGEVYKLGDHRLLVGDATKREDVERLFVGRRAGALWTDPPYGVDIGGKNDELASRFGKARKESSTFGVEGDASPDRALEVTRQAFELADQVLEEGAPFYVCHPSSPIELVLGFLDIIRRTGWRYRQGLVWDKGIATLGFADYQWAHEPIAYGIKPGTGRRGRGAGVGGWYGDNKQTTLLRFPKPTSSKDHPSQKPVELVEATLHNSTKTGDLVFDPFAGSGTTLVACERLGRVCYTIEKDLVYAQRALARWELFTGKAAELDRGALEVRKPAAVH